MTISSNHYQDMVISNNQNVPLSWSLVEVPVTARLLD